MSQLPWVFSEGCLALYKSASTSWF